MTKEEYTKIESFMKSQMQDSAHDKHHVYRVLNSALDIYEHENAVDFDILVAACLLHDIGREQQFASTENLCHAEIGGDTAYDFLLSLNWTPEKASHVKDCISTHRFRGNSTPESIEAKILFDADKLDVTGALGIARTLIYKGQVTEPLYILDENESIITDSGEAGMSSFFQEYNFKLKNIYDSFYTERAKSIAMERQKTAIDFYNGLYNEVNSNYNSGIKKHFGKLQNLMCGVGFHHY